VSHTLLLALLFASATILLAVPFWNIPARACWMTVGPVVTALAAVGVLTLLGGAYALLALAAGF
jgi:hypothetical protein